MAHSTEIANEFIRRSLEEDKPLTQMQLQKLVYISHGWNLAINGDALTDDNVQAWDYGPVYPDLWEALRGYGRGKITREIKASDYGFGLFFEDPSQICNADLNPNQEQVINEIYDQYSGLHAFQLSALTHQEDTPWYNVFVAQNHRRGNIDNESIRSHFLQLGNR